MKRQFRRLPKKERERIEGEYHSMSPRDFDDRMSRTKRQSPGAIRLPSQLVENPKTLAESEGEPEYQTMVKRWIEERLQKETSAAR
jgi:hypothetical protein